MPLSLGSHLDHRLVFQASLDVLGRDHLLFFEDFPYATYQADELAELVQLYHLTPTHSSGWSGKQNLHVSPYRFQALMVMNILWRPVHCSSERVDGDEQA